jgi:uncharacterized protein YbjT (DUF2867 family)
MIASRHTMAPMNASSHAHNPILVIGGTGMLGRPVVRRMVSDGLPVRVMARDPQRAATQLPDGVEIVKGDLHDRASVEAAMDGVTCCHVNLENAMAHTRPSWDPDADGSMVVLNAAKTMNLTRLTRIAALGVYDTEHLWWAAKAKAEVDRAWLESPVDCTIFHPTWFMESLPLFTRNRRIILPRWGDTKLHWVAGDDYAGQVIASMAMPSAANRVYAVQGPERLSPREAAQRYAAAHPDDLKITMIPLWPVRPLTWFSGQMHYMVKLMDLTRSHFASLDATRAETDLPAATMRIEDYVAYMLDTGDVPKK